MNMMIRKSVATAAVRLVDTGILGGADAAGHYRPRRTADFPSSSLRTA